MRTQWAVSIGGAIIAVSCLHSPAAGQLYRQNFEIDSTASWTIRNGPSDAATNFFFNYSTVGIPAAPSSPGTRGMKLQANLSNGVFSGLSVHPTGQSFTGDYIVRFDWWSNFNGPLEVGGNGATNLSTFGIGTSGANAQWPGAQTNMDSVFFAATGDGGSASDYRAYSTAATTSYPTGNAVYSAPNGAVNSSNPYYSIFGGVAAPAAQLVMFPQQTGTTSVGAAGMQWHHVRIRKSGTTATWTVDGRPIATIDLNTVTLGGSNIFFGHSDTNATSSTDPNDGALLFTLIDNVLVTRPADINGDGVVGIDDLLAVINGWGACPAQPDTSGCSADINAPAGNGIIDIDDLLMVINAWGMTG
jgi:hypothetical protein